MKMDRRKLKELGRMGKKMDNGLNGMKIDKRNKKEITKMGKEMDY